MVKVLMILLFTLVTVSVKGQNRNRQTHSKTLVINVYYKEAKPGDTLTLILDNIIYRGPETANLGKISIVSANKWFKFNIPVDDSIGYWYLMKARTFTDVGMGTNQYQIMERCLWEAGDNITIHLSNRETQSGVYATAAFSGNGAEKYTAKYKADSIAHSTKIVDHPIFESGFVYRSITQPMIDSGLQELYRHQDRISSQSLNILKADIMSDNYIREFQYMKAYFNENIKKLSDTARNTFIQAYKKQIPQKGFNSTPFIDLASSKLYISLLEHYLDLESYMVNGTVDNDWIMDNIIQKYSGDLRDRLLLTELLSKKRGSNFEKVFADVKKVVRDKYCLKALSQLNDASIGKAFTEFALPDVNGKKIKLSDFKGKAVLIDFWFNGCGGCQFFYKNALSRVEDDLAGRSNIVFISINGDKSKQRWLNGIKGGNYTSNRAVNIYTDGEGQLHPLVNGNNIQAFPFVVLLDKEGKIVYRDTENLYDYNQLKTAINSIR